MPYISPSQSIFQSGDVFQHRSSPRSGHARRDTESGFTLIEVLIAFVVLSIGLLGIVALQTRSLASSDNAYLTSAASIQAMSLEEMIRANAIAADTYQSVVSSSPAPSALPNRCDTGSSGSCTPEALATYDSQRWAYRTRALFPPTLIFRLDQPKDTVYRLVLSWTSPVTEPDSSEADHRFAYTFRILDRS